MRQFAIGAIVSGDKRNSFVNKTLIGSTPTQGLVLQIDHQSYFYAIIGMIAVVQLTLFIWGAFWANRLLVVDESYLAVATLLAPVVSGAESGSLLDGKEICEVLGKERVSYGSRAGMDRDDTRSVAIAGDGLQRRFPKGWYN